MAEFCKQCSLDNFGEDFGDFADMRDVKLTQEEKDEGMGWSVLCEGCGPTIVDDEGVCIATNCLKKHGEE